MKAQIRLAGESKKGISRKFNFTKESLAAINPPATGRTYVYDTREPGLEYVVTANGARSFNLYRKDKATQRPVRGKLDAESLDQARLLARDAKGRMARGEDPFEARKAVRRSSTLGELWEVYKDKNPVGETHGATALTRYTDESRWKACLSDWAGRKAIAITAADVRAKHTELSKKRKRTDDKKGRKVGGPITANRAIQLLRRIYNSARIEPNPAASKNWDAHSDTDRERFLQGDELQRLFAALDKVGNQTIADFLRMSLFTGARKSNVLAMKWADINLSAGVWAIPASESKNRKVMTVYLSAPALAILDKRKDSGGEYVFPGRRDGEHLQEAKSTWTAVRKAAKIEDVHLHDLRRTLGSWAAASGASLPIIGRQLGHQDSATTAIYARLNLEPVKVAIDTATSAMLAAATPKAKPQSKLLKLTLKSVAAMAKQLDCTPLEMIERLSLSAVDDAEKKHLSALLAGVK